MAQSPIDNAATSEIIRYDLGWNAINALLRSGRSLSGHERNCCFLNLGGPRFANISAASGLDFLDDGRVLALADWDHDGDIDFWIANRSGPQVRYVRNDVDNAHRYVALQLEGRQCNRDAIGARVMVVDSSGRRQFRTRRAGDGYLANCSSWIHFGLAEADHITRLSVRWPDGTLQHFQDVEVDRHYKLVEGATRLTAWTPPDGWQPLTPSELTAPPVSDRARIVLLNPIPLPQIQALGEQAEPLQLAAPSLRPRLITLWASWCQPCLQELSDWKARVAELNAADIDVLTVNLDQDNHPTTGMSSAASDLLQRLELPFHNAWAGEDVATLFDMIQRSLLSRQRPLPIPSSFLLDRAGRLRIVYKGPVAIETLLSDARLIDADPAEILRAAMPFEGRWLIPPGGSSPLQIALKLVEGNEIEHAEAYIRGLIEGAREHPEFLSASVLNLAGAIALDKQDHRGALDAFRRSIDLDPNNRQARIELAGLLIRGGRGVQAVPHLQAVLKTNPRDPELWYKLGLAQLQATDLAGAEQSMKQAVALRPNPLAYGQLGSIYAGRGDGRRSIEAYEAAIQLNPDVEDFRNDLAWLLATLDDPQLRNGPRAVELAESVCSSLQSPTANQLDTLAAAYAEVGRFAEAAEVASRAIDAARAVQQGELAERIAARRQGYLQAQPFRDRAQPQ